MAKLKKDQKILYGGTVIVTIAAVIYLLQPDTTTSSVHKTYTTAAASTDQVDQDPADDTSVHFGPYIGSSRDPFIPGVSMNSGPSGSSGIGAAGKWQLTGIDTVNGVTSALVENSSTQESEYLKVGDSWNGLKVVSIGDDVVNFVNAIGLPTQLGFAVPQDPNARLAGGSDANTPSINQITPLPPLSPGAGSQSFAFSRNGSRQ